MDPLLDSLYPGAASLLLADDFPSDPFPDPTSYLFPDDPLLASPKPEPELTPFPESVSQPASPQQENRACSHNVNLAPAAQPQLPVPVPGKVRRRGKEEDAAVRQKEKLAQRKLRNKESARRYREKQVARRRQLEQYTRSLSVQNRELESLHERLLRLTCQRKMEGIGEGVGGGVG